MRSLLLIVLLAGCVSHDTMRNQVSWAPPAYQDGYADGCGSGNVAAGHPYYQFMKDVHRFRKDDEYNQGWTDGFARCKGEYENIQRLMRR